MPRQSRRLAGARNNPWDVSFSDFYRMLEDAGFVIRSGKGSHYVARYQGKNMVLAFPQHNPMKIAYVRRALKMIDSLEEQDG